MSLTHFPHGVLATPNLGGNNSFEGWFGTKIWYVDGDNGSDDGGNGSSMDTPFKTIQYAINSASAYDTIYIKQLAPTGDVSDPNQYIEDLTIPFALHGLKLIGVTANGLKMPYGGPKIKNATATVLLQVNASNVHLENLQFNCTRNSGTYGILLDGEVPVVGTAYDTKAGSVGTHIVNCMIKNGSATYGGIQMVGGYGVVISNCTFQMCEKGVYIQDNVLPSNGHTIEYCNFKSNNGAAIAEHITIRAGGHKDISITDCTFDIATSFISCGTGNQGIIARCQFNDLVATLANSTGKVKLPVGTMTCVGCQGGVGLDVIQSQA
jgi:hypothetical protein